LEALLRSFVVLTVHHLLLAHHTVRRSHLHAAMKDLEVPVLLLPCSLHIGKCNHKN
jgi:hypothetical protein